MHTRDSSPDISTDTASLVNIINFTVTKSGLEDQLLGLLSPMKIWFRKTKI